MRSSIPQPRSPVVAAASGFAAGIVLDAYFPVSLLTWHALLLGGWMSWLVAWRMGRRRTAAYLLCAACLTAGGLRHHWSQSISTADNIRLFARESPQPVRITGRVISSPEVIPKRDDSFPGTIPHYDRTVCEVACQSLISGETSIQVTGKVRLEVNGHLLNIHVGDSVDVAGLLSRPRGASNPGGFDYRTYLQRRGIDAVLRSDFPDAIRKVDTAPLSWLPRQKLAALRGECEQLLTNRLSPRVAPIAIALLLGDRREVTDDMQTAFVESGTMHFLALSGLHVGILALLLWKTCRLLHLSTLSTSVLVVTALIGYALLTGSRPPVVRATVMAAIIFCGQPWQRQGQLENSLAAAALCLLLWNPAQLFEVGPQLSFLSVLGIAAYARLQNQWRSPDDDDEPAPPKLGSPLAQQIGRVLHVSWMWIRDGYLLSLFIWCFTVPLIAANFHVVSPVGLLINVLLLPIVACVLWLGYALLFCGLLLPPLATPIAFLFELGLTALLSTVDIAGRWGWGHWYVPGPPKWWLGGLYLLLTAALFAPPEGRFNRWGRRGLLCWLVLGLAAPTLQPTDAKLRCTFLSVGHGCAIYVELPGGTSLLYDAGQLHDSRRTERTVENAVWASGRTRIDAVVLSHADVDHFNALPGLVEQLQIGGVFCSPTLLDMRQPAVAALFDKLSAANVVVRLVGTEDRLRLTDEVEIEILQPAADAAHETDNANSLVVSIRYRGREILLTGDLEDLGLRKLLDSKPRRVDVLMAPHHGSLNSNSHELARWCRPEWVIVSGGRRNSTAALETVYGSSATVLSTWNSGAITVTIDEEGTLTIDEFARR